MNRILDLFAGMSPLEAAGWLLVENLLLFAVAIGFGELLARGFLERPVGQRPPPLDAQEAALAASCVGLNTVVTIAGWFLWRAGIIQIRRDTGAWAWLDVLVLLFLMDLAMYAFHRLAHVPLLYKVIHQTHHRYDRPRPLDLFVLNPLEVFGFGALWLLVISVYRSSWLGMVVYLILNVVFGTVGHLGVEPLPPSWTRWPVARWLGTSTFHAGHHHNIHVNFGFYTLVWDRLFGTLDPSYVARFAATGGKCGEETAVVRSAR